MFQYRVMTYAYLSFPKCRQCVFVCCSISRWDYQTICSPIWYMFVGITYINELWKPDYRHHSSGLNCHMTGKPSSEIQIARIYVSTEHISEMQYTNMQYAYALFVICFDFLSLWYEFHKIRGIKLPIIIRVGSLSLAFTKVRLPNLD